MFTLQSSAHLPLDIPAENRRSAPRVGVSYRISLRHGTRALAGYTSDISLTGVFVETREEVAPGTPVHLGFTVGPMTAEETVEVEGRVARWISPARARETGGIPGLGIEFTRFIWGTGALRHALDQLLAGCCNGLDSGRRHAARAAVGLPIHWGQADNPTHKGLLTTLSTSGAFFIQTCSTAPEGAQLNLWLELPVQGEIHVVRAVASVARIVEGKAGGEASGMGVQLEQSSIDRAVLQDFLDGRLSDAVVRTPPPPLQWPRPAHSADPAPAAAPASVSSLPTAELERHEEVHPSPLDRLFVEAIAEEEEAERRKRPSCVPSANEELRQDDTPPAPTAVQWSLVGRVTMRAVGMMSAALLVTFVMLILLLI